MARVCGRRGDDDDNGSDDVKLDYVGQTGEQELFSPLAEVDSPRRVETPPATGDFQRCSCALNMIAILTFAGRTTRLPGLPDIRGCKNASWRHLGGESCLSVVVCGE